LFQVGKLIADKKSPFEAFQVAGVVEVLSILQLLDPAFFTWRDTL
jgi:hypothetical protein